MSEKHDLKKNEPARSDRNTQEKKRHDNAEEEHTWKGVFEDVTYSSGPGDNIFIFG